MLKTLLKKQMAEIFRNYFYDPKKNKMRSRGATAMYIALYVLLMAGVLGGMFALLSVRNCALLKTAGCSRCGPAATARRGRRRAWAGCTISSWG